MSGYLLGSAATGLSPVPYFQIRSLTTGQIANGSAMEAYNQSHWSNYVNNTSEQAGSGTYVVGVPGYLPADRYTAKLYLCLGGSPASGDTAVAEYTFDWNGSSIIGIGSAINVGSINGSSVAAANLAISAAAMQTGAAAAGTLSTTVMTTNLAATVANIYAGRLLVFTSGVNIGLVCLITAYAVTGGKLTFIAYGNSGAPSAPSAADTFVIV